MVCVSTPLLLPICFGSSLQLDWSWSVNVFISAWPCLSRRYLSYAAHTFPWPWLPRPLITWPVPQSTFASALRQRTHAYRDKQSRSLRSPRWVKCPFKTSEAAHYLQSAVLGGHRYSPLNPLWIVFKLSNHLLCCQAACEDNYIILNRSWCCSGNNLLWLCAISRCFVSKLLVLLYDCIPYYVMVYHFAVSFRDMFVQLIMCLYLLFSVSRVVNVAYPIRFKN